VSWARIDDKMAYGAKTLSAGNEAVGAWVRMLAWSCERGTDGLVPRYVALNIAGKPKVIARLVQARMLDQDGDDYRIHDFLDWNPSYEEATGRKQARAEAGRRGGLAKALANAKQTPSKQLATSLPNEEQNDSKRVAKSCPLPRPLERSSISLSEREAIASTVQVLQALNVARKRAIPTARVLRLIPANMEQIKARLKEGATVEECLHVIAVIEAEIKRDKSGNAADWFDAVTPFRRENFGRKLGRTAPTAATGSAANDLIAQIEARELAEAKARGLA
jgi:hypothetical protein